MHIVIVNRSSHTLLFLLITGTVIAQDLLGDVGEAEFALQLLLWVLRHFLLSTLWTDWIVILARITGLQILAAIANIIPDPETLTDNRLEFVYHVSLCV